MKKVYQRIIDPKKGDCFKCCIASLLELDYDEVPNFVEQEDWFGAAIDFCKERVWASVRSGSTQPPMWIAAEYPFIDNLEKYQNE